MASMDFCGFTFNGYHSSSLGFIRVSNGNRYNDILVPTFQDKTVPVPGGDGTYFFESYYTQKPHPINIAFDSMTETQFRNLRKIFNAKAIGPLIFDERPYKVYTAKVASPPQLNFICFDDEDGNRVYKGEGTLQFVSYYPYARSVYKFLNEYNDTNKSEWAASSGMAQSQGSYDGTGSPILLFNPGDLETDFKAYYAIGSSGSDLSSIALSRDNTTLAVMSFSSINTRKNVNDALLCIDSKTNLIQGCTNSFEPTGSLYNEFLIAGDFFKIPLGETSLTSNISCSGVAYNYLYY